MGILAAGAAALREEAAGDFEQHQQPAGAGPLHAAAGAARVGQVYTAEAAGWQAAARLRPGCAHTEFLDPLPCILMGAVCTIDHDGTTCMKWLVDSSARDSDKCV